MTSRRKDDLRESIIEDLKQGLLANLTWIELVTQTQRILVKGENFPLEIRICPTLLEIDSPCFGNLKRKEKEAKFTKAIAGGLIGILGGLVLGPAIAPAVGSVIGSAMGLSGAAATSAGLAFLGGGSIAAGGLGMAGGTFLVSTLLSKGMVKLSSAVIDSATEKMNDLVATQKNALTRVADLIYNDENVQLASSVDAISIKYGSELKYLAFVGEMRNGTPHGRGILLSPLGTPFFEGQFRDGRPEEGTFYVPRLRSRRTLPEAFYGSSLFACVRGIIFADGFEPLCTANISNRRLERVSISRSLSAEDLSSLHEDVVLSNLYEERAIQKVVNHE